MYDKIYNIYDNLHSSKDYDKEVDFLVSLFGENHKTILDVGCGTGTHSIKLSELGYDVVGIDPSNKMIDIANSKVTSNNIKFHSCLINDYQSEQFDVIISMFNVVNHILTLEDLSLYFESISRLLKPSGVFIFDCFNQLAVIKDKPKIKERNGIKVIPKFDSFNSILIMEEHCDDYNYILKQKIWSPNILSEMVKQNNIKINNIFKYHTHESADEDDYKITFFNTKN